MSMVDRPFDFEGQGVRVVAIDGRPWFVARDVADVLGYADATAAVRQHARGVSVHHPLPTGGGVQQMRVLPESDVLRMIIGSRLPAAERFERWVFETVLPEVLRTGRYAAEPTPPSFQVPQTFAEALALAASQQLEIERAAPKAAAWDELADAAGDYSVGEAAKMLARAGIETGQGRLFATLERLRWTFRRGGAPIAMQRAVDSGLLRHRAQSHKHPDTGATVLDAPQVRVTVKGLERLRRELQPPITELTG